MFCHEAKYGVIIYNPLLEQGKIIFSAFFVINAIPVSIYTFFSTRTSTFGQSLYLRTWNDQNVLTINIQSLYVLNLENTPNNNNSNITFEVH